MDASLVTLIVGLLGGGTLATLVQFFVKRKDEKENSNDEIKADIKWLKERALQRDIAISQLKILNLIQHSPKDHKAIMMELENYFGVLHGNSWVYDVASKWARDERVNIKYIKVMHENNLSGSKQ